MTKAPQLNSEDWKNIERELCRRSFADYMKRAWPHIIPDPLKWGWHLDAMAEHLEAVADNQIKRLVINVPPGTSKSTTVGVMFPSYLWGPGKKPHFKFIGASHEQSLAIRDNRATRTLVTSDWFQSLWPLKLVTDQNEKLHFENSKMGFRQACAVKSMTGRRGHVVCWDDPINPEDANSEADRQTAIRILTETLPTRLVDPIESAVVVVMQRLHEDDPTGYILANDLGYDHLLIPMEFEEERRVTTSIGWTDPRTEEGELLDPVRFPMTVLDAYRKEMGDYAYAGQMQQRPSPRGGGLFKREDFILIDEAAVPKGTKWVRGWDLAASKVTKANPRPAFTAGVLVGKAPDDSTIIADARRIQGTPAEVEKLLVNTAKNDKTALRGMVRGSIPRDPGQAGKAQVLYLIKKLAGHSYTSSPESGDKVTRASPLAAQVAAGAVYIVKGPWNKAFLDEAELFPYGTFKDQIDAAGRAFNELTGGSKTARVGLG